MNLFGLQRFTRAQLIAGALIGTALLIRLGYVAAAHGSFTYPDEHVYHGVAQSLLNGQGFSAGSESGPYTKEPLYPFFLYILYAVFGTATLPVLLLQTVLSALTVYLIYRTGLLLFGGEEALAAAAMATFYPFFIFYNAYLLRETLLVLFSVTVLYYALQVTADKARSFLWFSLWCGGAVLLKEMFLYFWVLMAVMSFAVNKMNIKTLAAGSILFLLVLSPWVLRNDRAFGRPFITSGQMMNIYAPLVFPEAIIGTPEQTVFFGQHPVLVEGNKLPTQERDRFYKKAFLEEVRARPLSFMKKTAWRFLKLWKILPYRGKEYSHQWEVLAAVSVLSYGWILPCALWGGILLFSRIKQLYPLYLFLASFTLIYSLSWSQIRYRLPLEPVLILFCAYALCLVPIVKKTLSAVLAEPRQ